MAESLICAGVLLAAVLLLVLGVRDRTTFNERFSPISDAEFLARCSPGVNPQIALKVREIVAEYFGIEYERVHPSMRFIDLAD